MKLQAISKPAISHQQDRTGSRGALPVSQLTEKEARLASLEATLNEAWSRKHGQRQSGPVAQRYVNELLLDDLYGIDGLKDNLKILINQYNKRDDQVRPDFYGSERYPSGWYESQLRTLQDIQDLVDPALEDRSVPEYNHSALRSLLANLGTERMTLAGKHLKNDPSMRSELPHELHFIWSGKPIRKSALKNIQKWAKLAGKSSWKINVWTDPQDSDWMEAGQDLGKSNVNLKGIDQSVLDERLQPFYDTFIQGRNYPAASDVARYSILKKYGGVYVDVDIGPGDLSLNPESSFRPNLPLLAPEIRDEEAVRDELGLKAKTKIRPEMVKEVATRRIGRGVVNNNFIVSPPGTEAMEEVIEEVVRKVNKKGPEDLIRNPEATAAITGPVAVKSGLYNYVRKKYPFLDEEQAMDVLNASLMHDMPLEWITPESEMQVQ
ncbi:MAG TPA: TcdA/TcdB catalytic glycosyltransferase domain-containing protein [Thermoanaerobaculia bacterium]